MSVFSRRIEKLESNFIPDDANWEIVVLGEHDPEPENPEGRNRIIVRGIAPAPPFPRLGLALVDSNLAEGGNPLLERRS